MPKNRKHKWTINELIDSARDHVGHMLDNTGPRDIIYIACWLAGTVLIYNTVEGVKKIVFPIGKQLTRREEFARYTQAEIAKFGEEIDWNVFMLAMIGSYGLLKIDLGDVNAAVTKLQSAVSAAAAAI